MNCRVVPRWSCQSAADIIDDVGIPNSHVYSSQLPTGEIKCTLQIQQLLVCPYFSTYANFEGFDRCKCGEKVRRVEQNSLQANIYSYWQNRHFSLCIVHRCDCFFIRPSWFVYHILFKSREHGKFEACVRARTYATFNSKLEINITCEGKVIKSKPNAKAENLGKWSWSRLASK